MITVPFRTLATMGMVTLFLVPAACDRSAGLTSSDTTPTLEGEYWLMHNGYTQAEGVANLDQVRETGCLVTIGYPKFQGGLGGYARYVAICPAEWQYGVSPGQVPEAPLPRSDMLLHWDPDRGVRVRD